MQASKPSSATAYVHFSGPPAMPTARQPRAFASAPKALPTAPVAALTTRVWPALGWMIFTSPYQAVTPGMPTAPR
jgi:hypothetical protein